MNEQSGNVSPTRAEMGDTLERILREVEDLGEGESAPSADDRPPPSPPPAEDVGSSLDDTSPSAAGDGISLGNTQGNAFGALLGGLAGNPALLSAIPTLMESLGPLLGGGGAGKGGGGGRSGVAHKSPHHPLDRHTALLCAVKPYLGSERQEAAEKIIRLCRAWDALQKSGMTDLLRGLAPASPRDTGGWKGKGEEEGYVQ